MDIYLQTFGSRLRVKDGLFEVSVSDMSGNNYHRVEQYPAHEVKAIYLERGTSISSDVFLLALENGVDILVLDHFGYPQGRMWTTRPASTTALWEKQLKLSHTPEGLQIAKHWVEEKIRGRLEHLRKLKGYRSEAKVKIIAAAETPILEILGKLRRLPIKDFDTAAAKVRALEGAAGRHYLATLSALLPEDYQFEGRSFRPAEDAFNAFLNYGYKILSNKTERALLLAGLHPHIGLMHADGYQRSSLVFDFVEPYRVWIDKLVFKLFTRKQVLATHVTLRKKDEVWLAEEGRRLMRQAIQERFEGKKQEIGGRMFRLEGYLLESAKRVASLLLHGKVTATTEESLSTEETLEEDIAALESKPEFSDEEELQEVAGID